MTDITPELIAKAKTAKTHEELFELAKANNLSITEDEAKTYFAQLNTSGAISDDELAAVAGGNDDNDCSEPKFYVGDRVRFINGARCRKCGCAEAIVKLYVLPMDTTGLRTSNCMNNCLVCANCNQIVCDHVPEDLLEKV